MGRAFTLALAAALSAAAVDACGMTVHSTIANRALKHLNPSRPYYKNFYEATLAAAPDALQPGATFPDWGYECGTNHDNGEFAHWSTWQAFAAQSLAATYGLNSSTWNTTDAKTVAFHFGVVSHYIADISWHGLAETPSGYGMIETSGGMDFNATGELNGNAHTAADTGGEFVAAYALPLDALVPLQWFVPAAELIHIYALAGRTFNMSSVTECAFIFKAGTEAFKTLGALVEPLLINSSPTFTEHFTDLPCGGIDDMAVWTGHMWDRFADWMRVGPPATLPDCDGGPCVFPPTNEGKHAASKLAVKRKHGKDVHARPAAKARRDLLRTLAPIVQAAGLLQSSFTEDGAAFLIEPTGPATPADRAAAFLKALRNALTRTPEQVAAAAPLGAAAAGWTAPRPDDAAPATIASRLLADMRRSGYGAVLPAAAESDPVATLLGLLDRLEAVSSSSKVVAAAAAAPVSQTIGSPSIVVASSTPLEYLGGALAAGDFNGDGAADLVMTAWGHSAASATEPGLLLPQSGGFYVRYGGAGAEEAAAPARVGAPLPVPANFTPGGDVFSRLGWAACVADFNADGFDDVAVSAPARGWDWDTVPAAQAPWSPDFIYNGAVQVYYGRRAGLSSGVADVVIETSAQNGHLGTLLRCEDVNGDGKADLVIGSPYAQTGMPNGPIPGGNVHPFVNRGRLDILLAGDASVFPPASSSPAPAPLTLDINAAAALSSNGSDYIEWYGHEAKTLGGVSLPAADVLAAAAGLHASAGSSALLSATAAVAAHGCYDADAAGEHTLPALLAANVTSTLLFVGSPGFRVSEAGLGTVVVGRVTAYAMPSATGGQAQELVAAMHACLLHARATGSDPAPLPAPLFSFTGASSLNLGQGSMGNAPAVSSKFGSTFDVGYPLGAAAGPFLAIGIPNTDRNDSTGLDYLTSAGAVAVVSLPLATLRGDMAWPALQSSGLLHTLLSSGMPEARFGGRVTFADFDGDGNDDLLVAAHMFTPGWVVAPEPGTSLPAVAVRDPEGPGHESGTFVIFAGGAGSFPSGDVVKAELAAPYRASGDVPWGRLGHASVSYDWDGDGTNELVVAAPHANEVSTDQATYETPGAVYVFKLPSPLAG